MTRATSVAGLGILLAHAAAFGVAARSCERAPLRVDVATGHTLASAQVVADGEGAGVHRTEWRVRYRGGFRRSVGVTALGGPFQRAEAPPCGVRFHVGQAFLDDGKASPGTLAAFIREQLDLELGGNSVRGLGDFRGATRVGLRWSDEQGGSLLIDLGLRFEDGDVPVEIRATPSIREGRLRWQTETRARVRVTSSFKSFLVDVLRLQDDLDDAATGVGDRHVREVAAGVDDALAAPPVVPLGGGHAIRFAYCDDVPIRIVDSEVATVPLALIPASSPPGPVHLTRARDATPIRDGALPLAVDFDLDAVNAALHLLWTSGALDRRIRERGIADWFNEAELVERFLSVRVGELRLALPPTVERASGPHSPFTIAAEAGLVLVDGGRSTAARLFGRVGFDLTSDDAGRLRPRLRLDDLALSCEPRPGTLEPCYGAIVDIARRRAPELHGPVADAMGRELDRFLHERRLGDDVAHFDVAGARVSAYPDGESGWIRVGVSGQIVRH